MGARVRLERSLQTNHEGEFVEYLHRLPDLADPRSSSRRLSHTAARSPDALDVARLPAVEVHLSDVEKPRRLAQEVGLRRAGAGEDLRQGPDGTARRWSAARELGASA